MLEYEYRELNRLQQQATNLVAQIDRLTQEYDSLLRYSHNLDTSANEFGDFISDKKRILLPLKPYRQNNEPVSKYNNGMNDLFSSLGMRIVGGAFSGLQHMASDKLKAYRNAIEDAETRLSTIYASISALEVQIRNEERKMQT